MLLGHCFSTRESLASEGVRFLFNFWQIRVKREFCKIILKWSWEVRLRHKCQTREHFVSKVWSKLLLLLGNAEVDQSDAGNDHHQYDLCRKEERTKFQKKRSGESIELHERQLVGALLERTEKRERKRISQIKPKKKWSWRGLHSSWHTHSYGPN